MSNGKIHSIHLEELVNNLKYIGEDSKKIEFIIKEGSWFKKGTGNLYSLCDLLLLKYDGSGFPLELKGCRNKRSKALDQIKYGRDCLVNVFNRNVEYGKIVYYHMDGYSVDKVYFDKRKK